MTPLIDISAARESATLSQRQIEIVMLCAGVAFLDGLDLISISFVGPQLARALGFDARQLGLVFGLGLVGLGVGSVLIGPLSDNRGRRPALFSSVATFALGTVLTAIADNFEEVLLFRFITGLGLGGATPVLLAIVTEACPRRLQAPLSITMYCGVMLGGLFGAGLCSLLLDAHGWSSVMWVGGLLPLLYLPWLMRRLPESVEFLAGKGGRDAEVRVLIRSLVPGFEAPPGVKFVVRKSGHAKGSFRVLFAPVYIHRTLLTTVGLFCSLFSLFLYSSWLPGLLGSRGASTADGILATSAGQVGNLIGSLLIAYLVTRMSPYRLIAVTYLGAFLALSAVAHAPIDLAWQLPLNLAVGGCLAGSQGALVALAPPLFPADVRTRGVGFARGVGQIGATLGPSLAGVLLSMHWQASDLLQLAAVPPVVTSVCCLGLLRITKCGAMESAAAR